MEVSNQVDSWTAVVSEASATTVDALIKVIDFSNPLRILISHAASGNVARKAREGAGTCWWMGRRFFGPWGIRWS